MKVLAEIDAKEDIDESPTQLADRHMRLPTEMDSLQCLEQPFACAGANLLVRRTGESIRAEDPGRSENLTTILRRTGLARSPDGGGVLTAIQTIEQPLQETGFDTVSI